MQDLFFYLSKTLWFVLSPDHFLWLLTLLALFLCRRRVGFLLLLLAVLGQGVMAFYPLGNLLLRPLEQRFAMPTEMPERLAGIIVLGGGEDAEESFLHQQAQFNQGAERLMVLPALLEQYPDTPVIFTGGSGSMLQQTYKGGDAVAQWLATLGLADRVQIERESRNTFENAVFSRRLLADESQGPWLLVTSAFHMPRSVGVFRQAGWQVIPYPVDYRSGADRIRPLLNLNMDDLNVAVREWIGLLAYYLSDYTDALFPAPRGAGR
ncbi:YdcF family protein [Pontibacter sp. JAM-7]|uniref:YdcF family protein n=1 Tax=Pontibacter sp. JAM-7 TaxID=3366581 RepID=UPI003AF49EF7